MKPTFLQAAAAALMIGASVAMPPMGQRSTPRFVSVVERDGLGRKVKPPVHPKHNANSPSQEFRRRVESTHRCKPDGSWQEDPRDDKYLHSHARAFRGLRKAIGRAA